MIPERGNTISTTQEAFQVFIDTRSEQVNSNRIEPLSIRFVGYEKMKVLLITPGKINLDPEDVMDEFDILSMDFKREQLFAFPVGTNLNDIDSITRKLFAQDERAGTMFGCPYGLEKNVFVIEETRNGKSSLFAVVDSQNICPVLTEDDIKALDTVVIVD